MNIFKKQKHFISPARAEVREYKVRLMEKRHWWAWPLMPFLHELSELIMSCLPPRNNFQNIFSYRGWGSEGDKMSFPWSGENHINLQLNMFSCSKPSIYFIKPMPASVFLYGAIHLWRTIKWPTVCLGFSVYWLSLILCTFELNFHLTPVHLNQHEGRGRPAAALLDSCGRVRKGRVPPHCLSNSL